MSIENVKELFSKRVQESVDFNNSVCDKFSMSNGVIDEEGIKWSSLKEADAGITEYLSECRGFNAVIKERFSDFHVHEIDTDGNIVRLTNNDIPVVEMEAVNEEVLPAAIWEKLKNLKEKGVESVEIDVTDFSKEKRKDVHRAIKAKYSSLFNSNTRETEDRKVMVVSWGKDSKRKEPWYLDLGKYLHFVLYKSNMDTVDAINIVASKLRTKASNLTYAGTKDKRAKTTQWVSMWHLDARRLNGINNLLREIRVGNYIYKDSPLKLGDLKGNLFEIALRNVTESDEVINTALNTMKKNGFINYFGLQRFGNSVDIPTHEIGKALLSGDFKRAVELILKPRNGKMLNDMRDARKIWWETRDAERAFKCLRSKDRTIEGKLLMGLAKHGKNAYVNALDCIPRNVRLLYLHSYQSFIWNKVLSKRMKQFGNSVIEGDLVLLQGEELVKANDPSTRSDKSVRLISYDEIRKFEIFDVVHPLPGHNITYPNNIIKNWYEEFLKQDDLTSEKLKQTVKQYSLSGTYRQIIKRVNDLTWHVCHYSEPEEDLILSDFDKMNGVTLEINKKLDNKYKAVILRFSLDSSTYATMALREVLKMDTSVSYQAALNNYSNKRISEDCDEVLRKKSKT